MGFEGDLGSPEHSRAPYPPPQLSLDCVGDTPCGSGSLGIGGEIIAEAIAADSVVSLDATIARIEPLDSDDSLYDVIGVAPGTVESAALLDNQIIDSRRITVGKVTALDLGSEVEGPYLASGVDGAYKVAADSELVIQLAPLIDRELSIGDGRQLDNGGTVWQGTALIPAEYPGLGVHALALHSVDGGRDFTYSLTAE